MGPSTSFGTRATPPRIEPGTSGTSWPTGYARADSPSTGCWPRTCARCPPSASSAGRTAREPGPLHRTFEGERLRGGLVGREGGLVLARVGLQAPIGASVPLRLVVEAVPAEAGDIGEAVDQLVGAA